jgi:hypothetical protein
MSGAPCIWHSVAAVTRLCHYPSCQGTTTGTATTQITSEGSKTPPPPPASKTATTTTSVFRTLPPWTPTKIVTSTPAPAVPPLRHCAHHHAIPPNNCSHHLTSSFAYSRRRLRHIWLHPHAENECHQENAISAYFENAGREVTVLPCPNFANFLLDHSLQERNVSLIIDLPRYIIPAGICILQANKYSASPNQEWLPAPPDLSSFNALSQHSSHRSSLSLRALLSRRDAHGNQRLDPDGVDSSLAHLPFYHLAHHAPVPAISMGGNPGSHGGLSPLTH